MKAYEGVEVELHSYFDVIIHATFKITALQLLIFLSCLMASILCSSLEPSSHLRLPFHSIWGEKKLRNLLLFIQ
jgi:hypothetical protein